MLHYAPLVLDSSSLLDSKKLIREKIVPWEGLARAGVISADQANLIKVLETQNHDSKRTTVLGSQQMYARTLLNLLSKLDVDARDDVLKCVLVLLNDLLVDAQAELFADALLELSSVDVALPYTPFVKHLDNTDPLIKTLSFYNVTVLLSKAAKVGNGAHSETLIKLFSVVCLKQFIGNTQDSNVQSIGVQLLQELLVNKPYRVVFQEHNLATNAKTLVRLIDTLAKQPNSVNLQLLYNTLLTVWILSFSPLLNKVLVHSFPSIVGSLLTIAKEGIKLKVVRVAVSTARNFVSFTVSLAEQFSVVKLLLFHDGLNVVKTIQTRKFALESSDEELAGDLAYLNEALSEVVTTKLTSLDAYLVELENPDLLSWASPTHKSEDFWRENAGKFRENSFALVRRMMDILAAEDTGSTAPARVILLNDLQFLIRNIGTDLVNFINTEKDSQYKMMVMGFLENSDGDNELKYEALRTIQYLVGHA
ncbi:ATPase, V1 complex, subunit H [Metschnikowia bicuspidata var. bicuspidata NRRL YB-4993]|uniref:V-type proton ATPase subunit H n=1 Tax=Metschnikowia bicuspidata var. bicuspidata NRRL YB-4993 TaxID=869754 RepID=A0A1A0HEN1_9ASCO|nr:ATPase, V1 complex, subunit H [Metschnikowia bicuspidata var. bicuspidata NRRL YB-4993]OBA22430.1 ATPase, V1 complex, subunit H [Metschnikowia bicuspidata var. bicuspidata NRRL YB-4993]